MPKMSRLQVLILEMVVVVLLCTVVLLVPERFYDTAMKASVLTVVIWIAIRVLVLFRQMKRAEFEMRQPADLREVVRVLKSVEAAQGMSQHPERASQLH
jgi:hypothetical protein